MVDQMEHPRMREIKTRLDREILSFMKANKTEIIAQAKADMVSEVPVVPLFDKYLASLEEKVLDEVKGTGNLVTAARE